MTTVCFRQRGGDCKDRWVGLRDGKPTTVRSEVATAQKLVPLKSPPSRLTAAARTRWCYSAAWRRSTASERRTWLNLNSPRYPASPVMAHGRGDRVPRPVVEGDTLPQRRLADPQRAPPATTIDNVPIACCKCVTAGRTIRLYRCALQARSRAQERCARSVMPVPGCRPPRQIINRDRVNPCGWLKKVTKLPTCLPRWTERYAVALRWSADFKAPACPVTTDEALSLKPSQTADSGDFAARLQCRGLTATAEDLQLPLSFVV